MFSTSVSAGPHVENKLINETLNKASFISTFVPLGK